VQRAFASGKSAVVQLVADPEANANAPGIDTFNDVYAGDY